MLYVQYPQKECIHIMHRDRKCNVLHICNVRIGECIQILSHSFCARNCIVSHHLVYIVGIDFQIFKIKTLNSDLSQTTSQTRTIKVTRNYFHYVEYNWYLQKHDNYKIRFKWYEKPAKIMSCSHDFYWRYIDQRGTLRVVWFLFLFLFSQWTVFVLRI